MSAKPCPDCRTPIKATATKCACGWRSGDTKPVKPTTSAPQDSNLCVFELLGKRCPNPWVIARNGRRYCREHDPRAQANTTLQRVAGGVGDFNALRAKINAAKGIQRIGAAQPIGELAREAVAQRFETTLNDLPWEDGRE
ncbi:MAG TPA: hypothetical protein VJQ42_02090 [Rhodanobacteraceae bacterium]|nr:hypothetical protein [Rhodanobacteraceae bacterium]